MRCIFAILLQLFIAVSGHCDTGASPLAGYWVPPGGEAIIRISPDGDHLRLTLCAVLVPLDPDSPLVSGRDSNNPDPTLRQRPLDKLPLGRLEASDDDSPWRGRLYDPESGRDFKVAVRLVDPDVLEVHGHVGLPIFGKTLYWARLSLHQSRQEALWAEGQ